MQNLPAQELAWELKTGFVSPLRGQYGREAVVSDSMLFELYTGSFVTPTVRSNPSQTSPWTAVEVNTEGWMQHRNLRGGYLYASYKSKTSKVLILQANGHQEGYVNGIPVVGDVYGYGWIESPVKVKRGENDLLFHVARGRLKAQLTNPPAPVYLTSKDLLIPDIIAGQNTTVFGAVRVVNATEKELNGWTIRVSGANGSVTDTPVPKITALTVRKVRFDLPVTLDADSSSVHFSIQLIDPKGRLQNEKSGITISVPIKKKTDTHKITFVSNMDGSVQYYCVVPPSTPNLTNPALFLTLHGASVEATNQANAYRSKDWGVIVAPTNRRPYGFDWEDWGRLDMLEVLDNASQLFKPDSNRIYLTGHSMGGHGTWYNGMTFADKWAAIGPSAGWYSFFSYAGKREVKEPSAMDKIFVRASNSSQTLSLKKNMLMYGVYVLHGDQDDNVPVSQARFMRGELGAFHPDFAYYERPGAGHWWGNECVDWPPMFDFFSSHIRKERNEIGEIDFSTAYPGISSNARFITIWQQQTPGEFSHVIGQQDFKSKKIILQTSNMESLTIDLGHYESLTRVEITIDSSDFQLNATNHPIWFTHTPQGWSISGTPDVFEKKPSRYGGFKDAFRNRVVFVYGTSGTAEESRWAFAKARFDAETFWYRGNGSVDILSDKEYLALNDKDRNVVLYGNSSNNEAFSALLKNCPVKINREAIQVGGRVYTGSDLGIYFIYPNPDFPDVSIGVVSGTGIEGFKALSPNRYFVSGSGFPDLMLISLSMFTQGMEGVRLAGYFGNDWSVEGGHWSE